MSRIFVSLDIETNGPVPDLYSMLALGAAAFNQDGEQVDSWYSTLFPLPAACLDRDTMAWWKTQPEAWEEVISNRQKPDDAIPQFAAWCEGLRADGQFDLTAAAWPAAFDFAFVNYYCHRFAGRNPLGFSCVDIGSYARGLAARSPGCWLSREHMQAMTGDIDRSGLRVHVAIDDAVEQGRVLMALYREAQARHG